MLTAQQHELMMERQARVFEVADVVTKPVQFFLGGIKAVVFFLFVAIALVTLPVYWFFAMPEAERDANRTFRNNDHAHFYTLDFNLNTPSVAPSLALDEVENPPMPTKPPAWNNGQLNNLLGDISPYWGVNNFFNFDSGRWAKGKNTPFYRAYIKASVSTFMLRTTLEKLRPEVKDSFVDMQGAPAVRTLYIVDYNATLLPDLPSSATTQYLFLGMCLPQECSNEDFKYSVGRELIPSVTTHQQHAIDALESMQSDQYWLDVAHRNGVYDDSTVLSAARDNRNTLSANFPALEAAYPVLLTSSLMILFVGFVGIFFLYLCLKWVFLGRI